MKQNCGKLKYKINLEFTLEHAYLCGQEHIVQRSFFVRVGGAQTTWGKLKLKGIDQWEKRWVDSSIIRKVSRQTILAVIFIQIYASPILWQA